MTYLHKLPYKYLWSVRFVLFLKDINTFIMQWIIKLIKSDDDIFIYKNVSLFVKLSIHQSWKYIYFGGFRKNY